MEMNFLYSLYGSLLLCLIFFFFFFRATPEAYGSSQARGRIEATAASHSQSNTGSKPHLPPIPQLTAMLDS